ncbi:unannotated protein [freshwater metagenome]|uniref:Unannotated protein n=1 Tax=freshwater metagenome TaxID=449393 RepID=A0A6J6EQX9_9ZZZZ|nr:FkbM family methyltransferase [Actinomycetota bacterium]
MNKIKGHIRKTYFGDLLRHLKLKIESHLPYEDGHLGFLFRGNSEMKRGTFDQDLLEFLREKFPLYNKNFIDVGAHQGYFTCFANANKVKRVFAVEPDKINYSFLSKNVAKNEFKDKTECYNMGLSQVTGYLDLYGFSTGVSVFENWGGSSSKRKIRVKADTFDRQFQEILPLRDSIVKIDVEGFELEVIKGATKAIASAVRTIFIVEISLPSNLLKTGSHVAEVLKFFQRNGYAMAIFVNKNGNPSSMNYSELGKIVKLLETFQSLNFIFEKQS